MSTFIQISSTDCANKHPNPRDNGRNKIDYPQVKVQPTEKEMLMLVYDVERGDLLYLKNPSFKMRLIKKTFLVVFEKVLSNLA